MQQAADITTADVRKYLATNPASIGLFRYSSDGAMSGLIYTYQPQDDPRFPYIPYYLVESVRVAKNTSDPFLRSILSEQTPNGKVDLIALQITPRNENETGTTADALVAQIMGSEITPGLRLDLVSQYNIYRTRPGFDAAGIIQYKLAQLESDPNWERAFARLWVESWIAGYDPQFRATGNSLQNLAARMTQVIPAAYLPIYSSYGSADIFNEAGVNILIGESSAQWKADIRNMVAALRTRFTGK